MPDLDFHAACRIFQFPIYKNCKENNLKIYYFRRISGMPDIRHNPIYQIVKEEQITSHMFAFLFTTEYGNKIISSLHPPHTHTPN